jgi:hypothetical protein
MENQKRASSFAVLVVIILYFFGHAYFHCHGAYAEALIPEGITFRESYQAGLGLPVGKILSVQGLAILLHSDGVNGYRAKIGLPLFEGDTVITLGKGRIAFKLIDGSILTLASDTKLTIEQCMFNSTHKQSSSQLFMNAGMARFEVKKLAEFELRDFKVQTKTAAMSGRSADFIIRAAEASTEVTVLEDTQLELVSLTFSESKTILSDFQRVVIEAGDILFDIEAINSDEIEEILNKFRPGRTTDVFDVGISGFTSKNGTDEMLKKNREELIDLEY